MDKRLHAPFPFLEQFRLHHHPANTNKKADESFLRLEKLFLSIFEIGLFETYSFIYSRCKDEHDFKAWLIDLKGAEFYLHAVVQFNLSTSETGRLEKKHSDDPLSLVQHDFWKQQGYLKIEQLVSEADCDAVCDFICHHLGISLADPATWYPEHQLIQGMMVQFYQGKEIETIRKNEKIRQVFASLYGSEQIYPNTEKVSYNPPVTGSHFFSGSPLHWDIDFTTGPAYYIQGLVYLNDVPANRGAFSLIPGFQHEIDTYLRQYEDPQQAILALRDKDLEQFIPGKKGDLIVWQQALPHAATPNRSDLPRFVQYVSFIKDSE